MSFNPDIHHRRSLRLQDFDYSQAGAYFITVCTQERACLFGEVVADEIRLNDIGRMVQTAWNAIPVLHPAVATDAFVVMPNHIHGIIVLTDPHPVGAGLVPALDGATTRAGTRPAPTVGGVVGAFKSRVTVDYIRGVKTQGWPSFAGRLWQRNYYEHVIRNEDSLARIREYIANNPLRWALDRENPGYVGAGFKPAPTPGQAWEQD